MILRRFLNGANPSTWIICYCPLPIAHCQGPKSYSVKTTLILEDDFGLATHWRQLLEADGIRVIHECTAEDAITVLREESVDLLISDMMIKDAEKRASLYGGLMVISYVAMNMDPPPKILAVTGVDTDKTFLNAFGLLNPDTALRKPVADAVLAEKVQALLAAGEQDEREREEARLIERRMRRSLFTMDRSTEAIYWIDEHGEFVYANDAASKMFGRPVDELIGHRLFDIDPDMSANQWESYWREMSERQFETRESKRINSDGSDCWFLVDLQFYEFEEDKFIVANATDITQVKDDAERLRATNEELKHSNTELERFAYVASHDLKSPLRGISHCVLFLQEDLGEQLDEPIQKHLTRLNDSVVRMNRIIDDLLLYSRVFRDESKRQPVDLNACIEFATTNQYAAIKEANAVIHVGQLPILHGYAPLIQQLLQNLIGNAVKYRGNAVPVISIDGDSGPEGVKIQVCDNGIGIEPQFRQRVFEMFQRLHHRDEYSGTGIGLAICKRVMERHHGTITIDSNQNQQGCCFVLQFPLPKEN